MPVTTRLIGDLVVAYGFDRRDSFEMVSREDAERLGLNTNELHDLSVRNAMHQLKDSISVLEKEGVQRWAADNHLTATAILVAEIWHLPASRMTGDLAMVVPSRDCVMFCDGVSETAMRAMRRFAENEFASAGNHAISMKLLRWMGNGWHIPGTKEGLVIAKS
jgi:uncharacterized protein YtpQ (UPF0354 family)